MRHDTPSRTAEWVCFVRALDATRSDPIVGDPWARAFLSPPLRALASAAGLGRRLPISEALVDYVRLRHRAIDDALVRAIDHGRAEQVVILGAGYDTRAWRFAGRIRGPVFEVDHPATAARKAWIAARLPVPDVDLRAVTVDFREQALGERLRASGFVEGAPTFVAWEGVSMYLTEPAIRDTLRTLRALSEQTTLSMDLLWFPPGARGRALRAGGSLLGLVGEPLTYDLPPGSAGPLLDEEGWELTDIADGDELGRRYERSRVYRWAYVIEARATG